MGLFDRFKTKNEKNEITPVKAFIISLMYIMKSDGEIDSEEVGHLLMVVGGKLVGKKINVGGQQKDLLQECLAYVNANPSRIPEFVKETGTLLNYEQKLVVISNMIDNSLSDGNAEKEEEKVLQMFIDGWGIPIEKIDVFFEVLMLKNDRSVFDVSEARDVFGFSDVKL